VRQGKDHPEARCGQDMRAMHHLYGAAAEWH